MSIKALHIFLISCAALLSVVLGVWSFNQGQNSHDAVYKVAGVISLAIAVGLCFYAAHFIKKIKSLKVLFLVISVLILGITPSGWACTVCFGDPNSSLTQSIGWGIWVLMGFIGTVLILFAALFLNIRRRMKKISTQH